MSTETVRAVLWDADGVLQQGPRSWIDALGAVMGEEEALAFGEALWGSLDEALVGRLDMAAHLEEVLADQGLEPHRDAILGVWRSIDERPEARDVVRRVREGDVGCYLATNQDNLRASCMRELMGYDELLDGSYYSCELGVAKPSPAYFLEIAADLGLAPGALLFLDDQPENVDGAREAGLRAEQWHHSQGVATLVEHLAAHGVAI